MLTRKELNMVTDGLRNGGFLQATGTFFEPRGGDGPIAGCALGIISWILDGKTAKDLIAKDGKLPDIPNPNCILATKIPTSCCEHIMRLNDQEQRPFAFIADWMDRHVPCKDEPVRVMRQWKERSLPNWEEIAKPSKEPMMPLKNFQVEMMDKIMGQAPIFAFDLAKIEETYLA